MRGQGRVFLPTAKKHQKGCSRNGCACPRITCSIYWVQYSFDGEVLRENTKTRSLGTAHAFLASRLRTLKPNLYAPIAGVYAIHGPAGVYIGESADILKRATVDYARRFGLDWGIVRELPGCSQRVRVRQEKEVMEMFLARGFTVLNRSPLDNGTSSLLEGRSFGLQTSSVRKSGRIAA